MVRMKANARKMRAVLVLIYVCAVMLAACAAPAPVVVVTAPPQAATPAAEPTDEPAAAPSRTTSPEPETAEQTELPQEPAGSILVRGGDTLERDIIPQLCAVFGLSDSEVKDALGKAEGGLISRDAKGFRRMEGMIAPGRYDVTDKTLEEYVITWVDGAQQRYDTLAAGGQLNDLAPHEQLTLASIVEWECIGDEFELEAAAVFLNRLKKGEKLRSCATTEYALGYQRPYLTRADIAISDRYNTYQVRCLPPGPICAVDDDSLIAGISPAVDERIYYFFYDYAPDTMQFFTSYDAFKAAGAVSVEQFSQRFDIGKHDKISKRAVFGNTDA